METSITQKIWHTYTNFIGKINYLLFLSLAFSLALPYHAMRFSWIAWLISWGLEFRFLSLKNIRIQKSLIPVLILGVYFLWQALSYFWATDQILANKTLNRQISFIIIPFIALFGVNKNYNTKQISLCFIIGVFLTTLWYLSVSLFMDNYSTIIRSKAYIPLKTDTFERTFIFFFCKIKHRFFFATAAILASIVLAYSFKNLKEKIGSLYTWIFSFMFFSSTIYTIFLSGSRASILTYLLIAFIFLCSYFIRKKRWILLGSVVILTCCSFFIFYTYHPRMENITIEKIKNTDVTENDREPRFAIWNTAIKHIDEYVLTGKGVGNSISFLKEKLKENDYPKSFYNANFHSHNQYIEILMESGIIGLLLFLAIIFSSIKYSNQENKKLAFYLVLVFLINSLSDTIIRPLEGVILFSFVSLYLFFSNKEKEEN